MPSGNGCRAAMKRQKNLDKAASAGKASTNESRKEQAAAATAVQCMACFGTFSKNVKTPELKQHFDNKGHAKAGKTFKDCFPNWPHDEDSTTE